MKKKIGMFFAALAALAIVGIVSFQIGFNEGGYVSAWKYSSIAHGLANEYGDEDVDYIIDSETRLKNVQLATDHETETREAKRDVYTGKFLVANE